MKTRRIRRFRRPRPRRRAARSCRPASRRAARCCSAFRLASSLAPPTRRRAFAPNAFIRIDHDGTVTLIMPQVEMGQGMYTAIAMILAEELDAAWDSVKVEAAPPNDKLYGNPTFGAGHRQLELDPRVLDAAAQERGARRARCWSKRPRAAGKSMQRPARTEKRRSHRTRRAAASSRYGDLIADASQHRAAEGSAAQGPRRLQADRQAAEAARHAGQGQRQGDLRHRRHAAGREVRDVARPVPCSAARSATSTTRRRSRFRACARSSCSTISSRSSAITCGPPSKVSPRSISPGTKVRTRTYSTEAVWAKIRAASEKNGVVAKTAGDVAKGLDQGEQLDAAYEMPFLAHATMEPLNCTVHVTPDSCEVWVGSQVLSRAQAVAAKVTGFPLEKVIVHNHLIGGGFGRRLEVDMVDKAVRIAQKVDGPVKVVWTREEDIQHDIYRPVYRDVLSASLANGRIVGWTHRITGSSIIARWLPPAVQEKGHRHRCDRQRRRHSVRHPESARRIHARRAARRSRPASGAASARTTTCSRSRASSTNWRRRPARIRSRSAATCSARLRACSPRSNLAAEKSGWGTPLPARVGRGIAAQVAFGSFIATVIEVEVRRRRQREAAPHRLRGRYRHRRQSRYGRRAAAGRPHLRPDRSAVRRDHDRQGPRAAEQFPRLSNAAHRPGAEHRSASDPERRSARRHRRNRHDRRTARARQCDLRRDRCAPAPPADRPRRLAARKST